MNGNCLGWPAGGLAPPQTAYIGSSARHPLDREITFRTNFKGDFNEKKINYSFNFFWSYVPVLFSGFFLQMRHNRKKPSKL
jgi:hypothetical protein